MLITVLLTALIISRLVLAADEARPLSAQQNLFRDQE
jgi:hypothetical protein